MDGRSRAVCLWLGPNPRPRPARQLPEVTAGERGALGPETLSSAKCVTIKTQEGGDMGIYVYI